jgi:hypothetical protein
MRPIIAVVAIAAVFAAATAVAAEKRVTPDDRAGIALTIYENGLALVKDRRTVTLDAGLNTLAFEGIGARVVAESVIVDGGDGVTTLEQNFEYQILTPAALLKHSVGHEVGVIQVHPTTGAEKTVRATVLGAEDGPVLRIGNRIETGVPGRLVFDKLPAGLRPRPTLVLAIDSAKAGPRLIEVSYLGEGLSWRGDYVAMLDAAEAHLDLKGWATLTNASGARYADAAVKLVAGEVRRVADSPRDFQAAGETRLMAKVAAAPMAMQRETLSEYHLYRLQRPVTLEDRQTKQVVLLGAAQVPVSREYVSASPSHYRYRRQATLPPSHPDFLVKFVNSESTGLGVPLPGGIARVYKRDSSGDLQLIGEDRIAHTPKGQEARLSLGKSYDITVKRLQTDFAANEPTKGTFESEWRIDMHNAKDRAIMLKVVEPFSGAWRIIEESHPHQKEAADRAVWRIELPAGGSARLTYRVRVGR